ncbi:MAG TPA: tetratricopeptide repeat protein [Verrucomicrobiae bacterium]|nr:tetratricopeptide repeat protein [Verrucomicrobiae bacterium]
MNSGQSRSILSTISILSFFLAIFPVRILARSPQNPRSSKSDLRSQAEHGDASAQYRLASSILADHPSASDLQEALKWLRAAAAKNNPDAEFVLGYLYEHGQGVSQDYAFAFRNYRDAAAQHHPGAENNLASLYQNGLGVPKDAHNAFEWYSASAQHGDPIAQCNLAALYFTGSGTPRDIPQAVQWLRAASDSGLPEARLHLAYFYFYGIALPRDYDHAAQLVRFAARAGLPAAETSMGFLFEQGKGVPLDYVSAYTWYSRAITAGDQSSIDRRKQLAKIMTAKQMNEADALLDVSAGHPPLPASTLASSEAFSLLSQGVVPPRTP